MQQHHNKFTWVLIIISLFISVIGLILSQYQIAVLNKSISQIVPPLSKSGTPSPLNSDTCDTACKAYINTAVNLATKAATPSGSPTPTAKATPVAKTNSVSYIPLTGGQTANTDWTTIMSSQFSLNISDYGTNPKFIWDANLRVDNANGTTFARLYDTTHNIAVNGSEINLSNTSTSTDIVSGSLQFWSGNNTYVIQTKSLNSSTAFIDSGRIKITY